MIVVLELVMSFSWTMEESAGGGDGGVAVGVGGVWEILEMQSLRSEAEIVKEEGMKQKRVAMVHRSRRVVQKSLCSAA
jgi:hypothetical protein